MPGWIGHKVNVKVTDNIKVKIDLASPCEGLSREVNSDLARISSKARSGVGGLVSDIATTSRVLQVMSLSSLGSNKSGRLAGSIVTDVGGDSASIGTDLFYASFVNDGRGSVTAVGKALHFFVDGEEVFVRSVGPSTPKPYVDMSANILEGRVDTIVGRYLDGLL